MSNQIWSYYLPEDSGVYFWQPYAHQKPMCVFWNAEECIAVDFWGFEYHPEDGGRWSTPTYPDPNSSWDRPQPPQLEITNSTDGPVEVRVSNITSLQSDYIDNHPEMIEGLEEEDDNQSREDYDA